MVHLTLLISSVISFFKINKKSLLLISFILLFLFSALRFEFGNDYNSYLNIYNIVQITGENNYYSANPLFIFLNKISPTFQWFIAITSFIFLFAVYKLIKKNVSPEYHGIALLVFLLNPYIFIINLSAVRQGIAIALFIFAIHYAIKRNPVPYIILILAAAMFHTSAIVLLPVYFLVKPKKVSKGFLIGFIIVLFVLLLSSASFEWVLNMFQDFLVNTRYNRYLENTQGNSLTATLIAVVYLIYALLNIRKLDGKAAAYAKLYLVSTGISVLASRTNLFTRLDMYFIIFALVAIPSIIDWNLKNEKNRTMRILNAYVFPALILCTFGIKYYNFFMKDETWASFRTYKTNIMGFFE